MNIKVLGPGCAKCHQLEKVVNEVVSEIGGDIKVENVGGGKGTVFTIWLPEGVGLPS